MVEIKSTLTEIKNTFNAFISSRLDSAKEKMNKLKDMSIETFQTKIQVGEKRVHPRTVGKFQRVNHKQLVYQREKIQIMEKKYLK